MSFFTTIKKEFKIIKLNNLIKRYEQNLEDNRTFRSLYNEISKDGDKDTEILNTAYEILLNNLNILPLCVYTNLEFTIINKHILLSKYKWEKRILSLRLLLIIHEFFLFEKSVSKDLKKYSEIFDLKNRFHLLSSKRKKIYKSISQKELASIRNSYAHLNSDFSQQYDNLNNIDIQVINNITDDFRDFVEQMYLLTLTINQKLLTTLDNISKLFSHNLASKGISSYDIQPDKHSQRSNKLAKRLSKIGVTDTDSLANKLLTVYYLVNLNTPLDSIIPLIGLNREEYINYLPLIEESLV